MPPPDHQLVRELTPEEWSVVRPWVERRQQQLAAAALSGEMLKSMVALLNGGADPAIVLDPARRALYRTVPRDDV